MARTKVHIGAMNRHQIIKAIDEYAAKTGLAHATITGRAVNNSRLYSRMVRGGDCTTEIASKLLSYMADHPPSQTSEGAA